MKNVLKNSHAITNQNLFLRNDPDILKKQNSQKKASQSKTRTSNVSLSFLLVFAPPLVLPLSPEGRDFETKVGSIPRR